MVLERDSFIRSFAALGELLPMGKSLSASAVALAWGLLPTPAKEVLNGEHLLYAMQQLQADPQPLRELSITLQLLRYLFPLENDRPIYARGLRPDLPARMASPERFHPLTTNPAERPATEVIRARNLALPPAEHNGGIFQAVHDLLLAAKATKESPDTPALLTAREQDLASTLAAGSLIGYWTLEDLDLPSRGWPDDQPWRNLAREWIQSHPRGWLAMQTTTHSAQEKPVVCAQSEDANTPFVLASLRPDTSSDLSPSQAA